MFLARYAAAARCPIGGAARPCPASVGEQHGRAFGKADAYARTDAVCFAGGSLYGLEAATGVAAELLARRGVARWGQIAVVSGAIIYDFGPRETLIYPDKELGRRALLAAAAGSCPVGRRGAGRSATVGKLRQGPDARPEAGGQGAAFRAVTGASGEVKLLVVTVVNAVGVVVDRAGRVVRGCLDPGSGARRHPRDLLDPDRAPAGERAGAPTALGEPSRNTTLTAVVTNKLIAQAALTQMARQVHASMARAIQPFHTARDGDVLFALSTGAAPEDALDDLALAEIASNLAWDAVLDAVVDQ